MIVINISFVACYGVSSLPFSLPVPGRPGFACIIPRYKCRFSVQ
jgi:hypothetical protein